MLDKSDAFMCGLDGVAGVEGGDDGIVVDCTNSRCHGIVGVAGFSVTCLSEAPKRLRLTAEERFLLLSSLLDDFGGSVCSSNNRWFGGCSAFGFRLGESVSGSIP